MRPERIVIALITSGCLVAPTLTTAQEMHTIVDVSGHEVSVPISPKRIAVAWDRGITELVAAAGITPVAVASPHEFAPYLVEALNDLDGITNLGSHREIDLEMLATAAPDLILIQSVSNHGSPELLEAARKIAPVAQLDGSKGLREFISDFGEIMGPEYSDDLNDLVDDAVEQMRTAVADPSGVVVSNGMLLPGTIRLYKDNSNLASQLISEAGYNRPESQISGMDKIVNDGTEISMEEIEMLGGDILFLGKIGTDEELGEILESPLWQSLPVVSEGHVVSSDWRYWNVGGPLAAQHIADDFVAGLKVLSD